MKPNRPQALSSSRNYITVCWENCDSITLKKIENVKNYNTDEEYNEKKKRWYILEMRDRLLGWLKVYMGFKTQTEIGPLAPGDYYEFRLKVATRKEESDWSDVLFAVTKDDVVPVAQLHRVVENGPVITLRKILNQRPFAVDIPNKFGQTSLKLAILKNNTNFMGILLNHGADVDSPEIGSKKTALMIAAQRGQLEAVQLLIEKGSSWKTKDRNGLTALNYAVDNSHIEIVKFAVEDGADVKEKDNSGWTSFMRGVILKASLEVLEYLLDNGSDVNDADDCNQTVLMQAVLSDRSEVVEMLVNKGADVNMKNVFGHSAYDMAKSSTNEGIQKIIHLLGSEPEDDEKKKRKKSQRTEKKLKQKL